MSAIGKDPGATISDTTSRQLVVFSLGGEEYALPIAAVSEIIRHVPPRSVTSDTAGVRGVIGLRGKIVPIVDLAGHLGVTRAQVDAPEGGKIVILDTAGGQMGLIVDDVDEILTVSTDQLEDVPLAGTAIEAIAKVDERLVMVLDVATFVVAADTDTPLAAHDLVPA